MQIETGHWPKHPTKSGWLLKDKRFVEHRIVCTDGQEPHSIISDNGQRWTAKGELHANGTPSAHDLIIPPDPYEHIRAAFKAGQQIQYNVGGLIEDWRELPGEPNWKEPAARFRVKPQPSMVPLGQEDVHIGSACRLIGKESWSLVDGCGKDGITCGGRVYSFENMKTELEINRNDGFGWVPCWKWVV